jgi:hypothetical protein
MVPVEGSGVGGGGALWGGRGVLEASNHQRMTSNAPVKLQKLDVCGTLC